jgi:hypothetical protein
VSGPPRTTRSPLLLAAVWLAGAAAAVGTGLVAVNLVSRQVGDPAVAPLSQGDVGKALASPSRSATASPSAPARATASRPATATARPPASGSARPTATRSATRSAGPAAPPRTSAPAPQTRTFSSRGGSVGVRCANGSPSLVYATPANGYTVLERKEDADRVEVRFGKGGEEDEAARIRVGCSGNTPVQDTHG